MIDYKTIFIETFKNEKQKGNTITIICYNAIQKENGTFSFLSKLTEGDLKKYNEFLKKVEAKKESTGIYILDNIVLIGIKIKTNPEFNIRIAAGNLFKVLKPYGIKNFYFPEFKFVKFLREGIILSSYKFDIKTFTFQPPYFFEGPEDEIFSVKSQNFSRFLMDLPSNLLKPIDFTEISKAFIQFLIQFNKNIKIEIFNKESIKEKNMNLLLSVNEGSYQPIQLIKITYMGNINNNNIDYSFIGKGVTFDTGGISIKPSLNMHQMKSDMGGAGTCLASLGPIVKQNIPLNITIILPMVTNMPGGNATKPGDVIKAMNGKYVEILNTDAEGRLILADALTFAQEDKPKRIIDIATLTGAIVVALGENYTGYFSNNRKFAKCFRKSSKDLGELTWEMPLNDDAFFNTSITNCADFSNIGASRYGGSSTAASFLYQFIENDIPWIHIDMASSMDGGALSTIYGKGSRGGPVIAIIELLKHNHE